MNNNALPCRICESSSRLIFTETILGKYEISYYECYKCGFVQSEEPYWLEEVYSNTINISDTGIIQRNIKNKNIVLSILLYMNLLKDHVVDFAGGYGLLTRLLRDVGIKAYWKDKYTDNLFARGFEYSGQKVGLLTAFEVAEHLVYPMTEFREMRRITNSILISTELMPDSVPKNDWWYYGFDHGQHIGFYRVKTLKYIADELGCFLYTDGKSYHVLTTKKMTNLLYKFCIRFSNIMHIFSKKSIKSLTVEDSYELSGR